MVTRRTTQRTFFLRPDKITQAIFAYCLAEAAERFKIEILAWTLMSNHYHAVVHDVVGNLPKFIEHLHRTVAKVMNHRFDRVENFWSSSETSIVHLPTREDILRKVVYVLTNPVAADLVERVSDWQGLSSSLDYLDGLKSTIIPRPSEYFGKKSTMPVAATLEVKLPRIITDHESAESWAARVRSEVQRRENALRTARKQKGVKVRGWNAVMKTSPFTVPGEPRMLGRKGAKRKPNLIRPTLALAEKEARIKQLERLRDFRERYEKARVQFINRRHNVVFPAGTYKMRLLGARCEPFPVAA